MIVLLIWSDAPELRFGRRLSSHSPYTVFRLKEAVLPTSATPRVLSRPGFWDRDPGNPGRDAIPFPPHLIPGIPGNSNTYIVGVRTKYSKCIST